MVEEGERNMTKVVLALEAPTLQRMAREMLPLAIRCSLMQNEADGADVELVAFLYN
jgi:hypothetical protein